MLVRLNCSIEMTTHTVALPEHDVIHDLDADWDSATLFRCQYVNKWCDAKYTGAQVNNNYCVMEALHLELQRVNLFSS